MSPFHRGQSAALHAYRAAVRTGLLSHGVGRSFLTWAYLAYKRLFEARHVEALRPFVSFGTVVIDVGANVGFFTTRFGRWVGGGGRVLAIEPEGGNLAVLRRRIARRGLIPRVEIVEGAAAEATSPLLLVVNPYHPGDHRLGERGIEVKGFSIDDLVAERGNPQVSLIKIDVQGAEFRVLRGAGRTLRRSMPALFVEIDDGALRESGSSAEEIATYLASLGYEMFVFDRGWVPISSMQQAAAYRSRRGYCDYLFKARPPSP